MKREKINGFEVLGIAHAMSTWHTTEHYRYVTTFTEYRVRGYMVMNKMYPNVHCGTVYCTKEEAEQGMNWRLRELRSQLKRPEPLYIEEYELTEMVITRKHQKLG